MKELELEDGDMTFNTLKDLSAFENKLINSLKVFSVETFWDVNKGLSFDVISSKQANYKLQHIKSKIQEWFGNELEYFEIKKEKIEGSILYVKMKYIHKFYKEDKEREVLFNA